MQKCVDLEEPRKRLNENQQQEKENEVHEKVVYEKLPVEPIKDLKSVFLGVKSPQIVLGHSNTENSIFHPYNRDTFQ